jgi:pyruvate-formate lyase
VTVTVYATCTAASPDGRTAQSANMTALWPAHASPSPSAT